METIAPAALLPDLKIKPAGRARRVRGLSTVIGAACAPWPTSNEAGTRRQRPNRGAGPRGSRDQRDMTLAETPILPQLWPQY
jgi:hypothetical protein